MRINASTGIRAILFWISLVFLGVMLWKLVSTNGAAERIAQPTYEEFIAKVEAGQVRDVRIYSKSTTNKIKGYYVRPANVKFELSVVKEISPALIEKLREQSVSIQMQEDHAAAGDWTLIVLNAAPLILLLGFGFYLMRQMSGSGARLARLVISKSGSVRTGIGYDLHRLDSGRPLMIGGIEVPFDKGPVGHSDGDVLAHALCDALFGAAGLGDIGTHFPDTDPKWKGANSLVFLEHAKKLLDEKKLTIEHVDAVVILERPKLGPHFPKMREALAKSLGVTAETIHLKAKTNEGVDAVGCGEAIACYVVATLSARAA